MDERITLVTIGNGAAMELFERELTAVLTNIQDVNTSPTAVREISIKVKFRPNEKRESAGISLKVDSKLAGVRQVEKEIYLGKQDGEHIAVQSNPRQGRIFDPVPTADDMKDVEGKMRGANDR